MRIRNPQSGTYIYWTEERLEGHPLTRHWTGPGDWTGSVVHSKNGDTPEGRDREVEYLIRAGWVRE